MANFLDKLRGAGSKVLDGIARVAASFQVRHEHHAAVQRAAFQRPGHQRRQIPTGEAAFSAMMRGAGGIGWPASWTQDRARQIQQFHRWVFIAVDRIASRIAAMPPQIGIVRTGQEPKPGSAIHKALEYRCRKSLQTIKPHEEIEYVGPDHPLARLLARPNGWVHSPGRLWYQCAMFLCLTGNAYQWIVPDSAFGMPLECWTVPSHWVFGPKLGPAGAQYYEIQPFVGGVGGFKIPADEMVHYAFDNPLNPIDGWSPTQAASEWVDVSTALDQSQYFQFINGSQANGALELGPKYDPDDTDIDAIGSKFLARYQGVRNAGVPVVLPPDVKLVPLTIAPKDMSYLEGGNQKRDEILAAFGVPHEIAGITDAGSHTAYYGPMIQFSENAIFPKVRMIGDTFTACVCKRWDDNLRLWWEDHNPPDPEQLNADIQTDKDAGAITINQICALRGREPFDDPLADEPLVDPNRIPLSMLAEKLKADMQQSQAAPMGGGGGGPMPQQVEEGDEDIPPAPWDEQEQEGEEPPQFEDEDELEPVEKTWSRIREEDWRPRWVPSANGNGVHKSRDAAGHEHKPSGPGGGQFTSGGGGGGGDAATAEKPQRKPASKKPASPKPSPAKSPKKKPTEEAAPEVHPGAAHGSAVKIKPSKQRAWNNEPVELKTTLTKQETGRVGEAVILAYLREHFSPDAAPMNSSQTNFPIDLLEDHAPTECKAGLASNSRKAEQWRLTFSKESETEKKLYEKMTPEERTQWNAEKQQRIKERKEAVIQALEKEYPGEDIKPRTMTAIINPDTKTADLFIFDGFHDRIDWRSEAAKKAFVGSVTYEHHGG